jgi:catalase-peroxidase
MTDSVSESENPAIPSPTPEVAHPRTNRDWWPNQLDLRCSTSTRPLQPAGRGLRLRGEFRRLDVEALKRTCSS